MDERRLRNICFHGVGTTGRDLERGEDRFWITADALKRILDEIATWPNFAISFDDGNHSDLEICSTALRERNLSATFFVLAGRFGSAGSLDEGDVRELHSGGMKIGSHGMDHRPWRGMSDSMRHTELVRARAIIAEAAGCSVDEAAAPFGSYDRKTLSDLRSLGYAAMHTSDARLATAGKWLQPRFTVRRDHTAESLRGEIIAAESTPRRLVLEAKGVVKRLR